MIELSHDSDDGVVVIACSGTVTTTEFEEVVNLEFDRIVPARGPINFVLHLGEQFDRFGPGAWGELTENILRTRFHRGAVVTDNGQLSASANLLKWMLHGNLRTFHDDELDRAIAWVSS